MISAATNNSTTGSSTTGGTTGILGGATTSVTNKSSEGKDTFLKLLVAQLKYQNPLSPMDGTEFVAQTAQFSMVERLEEMSRLSNEAAASSNIKAATELVGRRVTYDNGQGTAEGVVTSARLNGGAPTLLVGKAEIPLNLIREVRSTASDAAASAASAVTEATTPAAITPATPAAATPAATTPAAPTTPAAATPTTTETTPITAV